MPAQGSYDQILGRPELDFEVLVDRHYASLYRFAVSLARTENDAADLVQDTFLTWAAKGHQLHDPARVKAWLFTTLHRRFLESQRRGARFPHVALAADNPELPEIQPEQANRLDAQTILDLLNQVHPQYRAALSLFYLEDLPHNEIAAILDIPRGTVKSRIARGLGQLRQLLKDAPGGKPNKEPS